MLTQDVRTLTLTNGGTDTFPTGFVSLDQVVYSSQDGSVFEPNFTDYTLVGNVVTYPAEYTGTVDQYFTYNTVETGGDELAEGWSLFARTQQVAVIPSTLKVDLCDVSGNIITGTGYAQGSVTIGAADGNGQRKNTTAKEWIDADRSWGEPTAHEYVKLTDVSGNEWGIFPWVTASVIPDTGGIKYSIAIGQIIFG